VLNLATRLWPPLRCGGGSLACCDSHTSFRVLAFYTAKGEPDHIAFAAQAPPFFAELARKPDFESTTRWEALNAESYQSFGDNQTLGGSASELGEQLAASSGVR